MAISDTVRERIVRGGLCPAEQLTVLYPGVAAARIAPGWTPEPHFPISRRIMWTKNRRLGLEAFALVRTRLPGWRLVIAGMVNEKSRGYASELMARAEEVDAVAFRISPTDVQMRDLHQVRTALLSTAFTEGWCLTPLEAIAAGRPVIAVNRDGPRESVADGQTGVHEPAEPAAFVRRMARLAEDPALARRLGEAALERARRFSLEAFVADPATPWTA